LQLDKGSEALVSSLGDKGYTVTLKDALAAGKTVKVSLVSNTTEIGCDDLFSQLL